VISGRCVGKSVDQEEVGEEQMESTYALLVAVRWSESERLEKEVSGIV
jgi:hypothetical protein